MKTTNALLATVILFCTACSHSADPSTAVPASQSNAIPNQPQIAKGSYAASYTDSNGMPNFLIVTIGDASMKVLNVVPESRLSNQFAFSSTSLGSYTWGANNQTIQFSAVNGCGTADGGAVAVDASNSAAIEVSFINPSESIRLSPISDADDYLKQQGVLSYNPSQSCFGF